MVKSPKTGKELGGETIDRAPPWFRKILDKLGLSAVPNPEAYEDEEG